MRAPVCIALCAVGLFGCMSNHAKSTSGAPSTILPPIVPDDVFEQLKDPVAAHAELCANDGAHPNFPNDADKITATYCQDLVPGGTMPQPKSLAELMKQLGLDFKDPSANGGNGTGGNPGFALLGHSSALTARKVSTLTPTAFVFTPPPADGSKPKGYVFLAFDPGERFVEVASHDPTTDVVNFYLVIFEKDCARTPQGCTNADLLTHNLVTGWTSSRVYEMTTDLGNTIMDCHVCHQPDQNGQSILRMQEIEAPFTHWFSSQTAGGQALLADYHAGHGFENYGPIPGTLVDKSDPALMAQVIKQAGFGTQPNPFPSATVEQEVSASSPSQPAMNVPPGVSPSWQSVYDAAVSGQFIAAPYHDVKVTDPGKLWMMTNAYLDFLNGKTTTLPDIRDVFLDDALRDMGFAPKAGLDGRGLLQQMCQECHQSKLDPNITRERFLVDQLDQMSRAEKDLAIERINFDPRSRLVMPPLLFRTVTDAEKQSMIDELMK